MIYRTIITEHPVRLKEELDPQINVSSLIIEVIIEKCQNQNNFIALRALIRFPAKISIQLFFEEPKLLDCFKPRLIDEVTTDAQCKSFCIVRKVPGDNRTSIYALS